MKQDNKNGNVIRRMDVYVTADVYLNPRALASVKAQLIPLIQSEVEQQIRSRLQKLFSDVTHDDYDKLRAAVMRELE